MATCGSKHPTRPELHCILPFEHADDHQSGYGGLAESWPNRAEGMSYFNVSDMPSGHQAQLAEMNRIARDAKPVTHARPPDGWAAAREAMDRVERGTDPVWREEAQRVVYEVACHLPGFTTDDLWAAGLEKPRESRAIGPIMTWAKNRGWIRKIGLTQTERRHGSPKIEWESLIYVGK